jgi:hypothetical protein
MILNENYSNKSPANKTMKKPVYLFLFFCLWLQNALFAVAFKNDSISSAEEPRHYIRPTVYMNNMGQRNRQFKSNASENFGFSQGTIGFVFPMYTHASKDSLGMPKNVLQVAGNASILTARPRFSMIEGDKRITRTGFAANLIYSIGQKHTLFFSFNPFIAEDRTALTSNPALRYTWLVIYNGTVNEKFSYRLGWARSFILGGLPRVPIIGFRIGRYDRIHFNFQYPRYFSLDVPFAQRFQMSFFHRFTGGIYGMRDVDFKGVTYDDVILRRAEQLTGFELSVQASSRFSFFLNIGAVSKSRMTLNDVQSKIINRNNRYILRSDYGSLTNATLERAGFLGFGLQVSFGKAKKSFNNQAINDALDMNRHYGSGDNNDQGLQADRPMIPKDAKLRGVQMKDVEELVNESDLY